MLPKKTKGKQVKKIETVASYVGSRVAKEKSGELLLDVIQKAFPTLPRNELIRQVREVPATKGKFVIGRRGGASRFLFGDAAINQPIIARQPKAAAPRNNGTNKPMQSQGFSLKVRMGDMVTEIPVGLELAVA